MLTSHQFLDKLIGDWELIGQMGNTPLRQSVTARWILNGLFVEMVFKSTLTGSPYEAVYLIGYNSDEDVFVLNLFDTFGVSTKPSPGMGKRDEDSIPFIFDYADGPFTNHFIWDDQAQSWRFEQTFIKNNTRQVFATKHMTRSGT